MNVRELSNLSIVTGFAADVLIATLLYLSQYSVPFVIPVIVLLIGILIFISFFSFATSILFFIRACYALSSISSG